MFAIVKRPEQKGFSRTPEDIIRIEYFGVKSQVNNEILWFWRLQWDHKLNPIVFDEIIRGPGDALQRLSDLHGWTILHVSRTDIV